MEVIERINTAAGADPEHPKGQFYGYSRSSTGPGDDAFRKCLELARKDHVLLITVYGEDDCEDCDEFVRQCRTAIRDIGGVLMFGDTVNAYFRGGRNVPACADAYSFLKSPEGEGSLRELPYIRGVRRLRRRDGIQQNDVDHGVFRFLGLETAAVQDVRRPEGEA